MRTVLLVIFVLVIFTLNGDCPNAHNFTYETEIFAPQVQLDSAKNTFAVYSEQLNIIINEYRHILEKSMSSDYKRPFVDVQKISNGNYILKLNGNNYRNDEIIEISAILWKCLIMLEDEGVEWNVIRSSNSSISIGLYKNTPYFVYLVYTPCVLPTGYMGMEKLDDTWYVCWEYHNFGV